MQTEAAPIVKPYLRGVSHALASVAAVIAGRSLARHAPSARAKRVASVYVSTMAAMYSVSATYHVPRWRYRIHRILQKLDHATIFIFIAGTYTPVTYLLPRRTRRRVLGVVWGGAIAGALQALLWNGAPRPVRVGFYLAVGWCMVPFVPDYFRALGPKPMLLILSGGALYSTGAVIYARGRPDPIPKVFGYHEIFHALVIAASVCHFAAVLRVLPKLK